MQETAQRIIYLPAHMTASMARDLGFCLTGHVRETALVRYLALSLMYLSWHFEAPASLEEIANSLLELPDDDGASLLDNLAHPPAYSRRGDEFDLPISVIRTAQKEALRLKKALMASPLNILALHARSIQLVHTAAKAAQADAPEKRMLHSALEQVLFVHDSAPYAAEVFPAAIKVVSVEDFEAAISASGGSAQGPTAEKALTQEAQEVKALQSTSALSAQLFQPLDALKVLKRLPLNSPDVNAQLKQLLESLASSSGLRGVAQVQESTALQALYKSFPHFTEVLDHIASALALAACGEEGRPFRMPAILLRGAPGTGKTYFAQEVARALGVEFIERDLSVTSEAFVISGMDSGWKNSKPGLVFDALVHGKTANPLVCLNEVDKCKATGASTSPIAPLFALLEPASARRFTDEFVTVPLDASRIGWILTANDGPLPEPILSRLEIFEIPSPTPEQSREIAASVWAAVSTQRMPKGHGFPAELPSPILEQLITLSPREMRKALTTAASLAAWKGRKRLIADDLSQATRRLSSQQSSRPIGFLAHGA